MKRSMWFQMCVALCSVLLRSPSIKCFSLQKLENRNVVDVPGLAKMKGVFDGVGTETTSSLKSYPGASLLTTHSTVDMASHDTATQPYGTSSNSIFTVQEETENHHSLLGNSTMSGGNPEINSPSLVIRASPNGQTKASSENGILTTAVYPVEYTPRLASLTKTTVVVPDKLDHTADQENTKIKESSGEHPSPVNTMEMLTTNPRTSNVKAEDDLSTLSFHLVDHPVMATRDNIVRGEASLAILTVESISVESTVPANIDNDLESATPVNLSNGSTDSIVSLISEEWDDTKIKTTSSVKVAEQDNIMSEYITTLYATEESTDSSVEREAALSSTFPVITVHSEDHTMTDAAESVPFTLPQEIPTAYSQQSMSNSIVPLTEVSMAAVQDDGLGMPLQGLTAAAAGLNQELADALGNQFGGVGHQRTEVSEDANTSATGANLMDVITQETTRELEVTGKVGATVSEESALGGVTQHWQNPRTTANIGSSTTAQLSFAAVPHAEGLIPASEEEIFSAVSETVTVFTVGTIEAEKATVTSTVTSPSMSSEINMMIPSATRVGPTVTYGLQKLESEEGDEEEEEEEEEEDDDDDGDDDEEEEEDKDTDSVDDSVEGDADLPTFTLPGLSSQEPLEDERNVVLMAGAAYQVPDTLEWEHQNQGLVRSWMEKLKDKAGYMSGMLVPVGVGVAGALFILGALYSIKIMNRRRRNGFKRHKRKQREFNSMQDRVMLLADSSEDEF
ncbi:armadillo-like helical domain-containing protein 4 isoform X2 [Ascaphus truei]|uniref:armadillo-like helical domain-containing protein 4 isoform X2 n=1 Tax=Ascaphus truei TaxID=8439 RepID=UPI003F59A40F